MKWALPVIMLLLAACSGAAPAPTGTPAIPSAAPIQPTDALAQETPAPTTPAGAPATSDDGEASAGSGGAASLTVGDRSYEMTGNLCQTIVGIQASLATANGQASMSVFMTGSTGQFLLLDFENDEQWLMPDDPPAWDITDSVARWSGTLHDTESGRDAPAQIEIRCAS